MPRRAQRRGAEPGRTRTLAVVIGVSSAASSASLCFATLAPFFVDDLGLGFTAVAALNAALFVGAAAASPWAGRWVDRLGYGPALTRGVAGMIVCFLAATAASGYWWLLAAAATAGLGFAFVNPAANLAVGAGFDPRRRGTVMGLKQTGISLGGVGAGVWLPAVAIAWGWRVALLQVAALLVVAAAVSAATLGALRRVAAGRESQEPARPTPRAYALWTGGVLLSCPQALLMLFLVLYVSTEGGVGPALAGVLFAATQVAALIGRVALGVVSDIVFAGGRRTVLVGAALGAAAVMFGLAAVPADAVIAVVALAVLGGLTAIGWNGVYMAALVDVAPPDAAGAVSGVGVGLNLAAVVAFPLVAGALLDAGLGFSGLWVIGGAGALAAAAAFFRAPDVRSNWLSNVQSPDRI